MATRADSTPLIDVRTFAAVEVAVVVVVAPELTVLAGCVGVVGVAVTLAELGRLKSLSDVTRKVPRGMEALALRLDLRANTKREREIERERERERKVEKTKRRVDKNKESTHERE